MKTSFICINRFNSNAFSSVPQKFSRIFSFQLLLCQLTPFNIKGRRAVSLSRSNVTASGYLKEKKFKKKTSLIIFQGHASFKYTSNFILGIVKLSLKYGIEC